MKNFNWFKLSLDVVAGTILTVLIAVVTGNFLLSCLIAELLIFVSKRFYRIGYTLGVLLVFISYLLS